MRSVSRLHRCWQYDFVLMRHSLSSIRHELFDASVLANWLRTDRHNRPNERDTHGTCNRCQFPNFLQCTESPHRDISILVAGKKHFRYYLLNFTFFISTYRFEFLLLALGALQHIFDCVMERVFAVLPLQCKAIAIECRH